MDSSRQLFQYILSGLSNGAIYALIGFGFAIIFNATGIINFAQGEFVMLGGMLTFFFLTELSPCLTEKHTMSYKRITILIVIRSS